MQKPLAVRAALALIIAIAFGGMACGCSQLGQLFGQKITTPAENLQLQRQTATKFKSDWPATDAIRFTQPGNYSGAGTWAANAVVTIAGKDYREILGPYELIGEALPDPDANEPTDSVTVHYSNGKIEVLR